MTTLDQWRCQLESLAEDYLPIAEKRRRPMTVVLRIDENGNVLPAKVSQEIEKAERMERVVSVGGLA